MVFELMIVYDIEITLRSVSSHSCRKLRIGRQDQHPKALYRFRKPSLDAHYEVSRKSHAPPQLIIGIQTSDTALTGQNTYVQVALLYPSARSILTSSTVQ